ncbi:MAG: 16S rRNA (guanine(966)-N(2))-methyltransferase RsmD [Bacilli bacterium]|nr:16S rRNA (guanine(966)-N(2))-methyltransferase RsmD [Bacilli bacterium]
MMRIIAGIYRHRLIDGPIDNPNIRPTKDRIREAIFSSFGDLTNKVFLDLFSGSGSIGLEAISRGVTKSYFVDNSPIALNYINKNLNNLAIQNGVVVSSDALLALESFANEGIKFDIIYIDPPYESDQYLPILSYIYSNKLLNNGGIVAFESNRKIEINDTWYSKIKEYHYGDIMVTVLK